MASSSRTVALIRGDAWDGDNYTITKAGFDFTGTTVKVQVRDKADGTIYATLTPTPAFPSTGTMTFSVNFTGAQTATFPTQILVADVQVYRASPLYGPYTLYNYKFDVKPDITQ